MGNSVVTIQRSAIVIDEIVVVVGAGNAEFAPRIPKTVEAEGGGILYFPHAITVFHMSQIVVALLDDELLVVALCEGVTDSEKE